MNQWREEMKARTHKFAVDVIHFVEKIPTRLETRRLKDQLLGAACGMDGNWHAACRARTHKEFTATLGKVLEEADEAEEWLDVAHDAGLSAGPELRRLRIESKELRSIFSKSCRTANENERRAKRRKRRQQGE